MLHPSLIHIIIAALLLGAAVQASASSPPLTWQEHLAAGEAILQEDPQRFNEARVHFARALELAEAAGSKPLEVAHLLERLAETVFLGIRDEAEPIYLRALAIREQHLGENDPSITPILEKLADIYDGRGCYKATLGLLQRSLKIRESAHGPDDPRTGRSLVFLALLLSTHGEAQLAETYARRAVAIAEQAKPPDYDLMLDGLVALESAFRDRGRAAEADAVRERFFEVNDLYQEQKRQRGANERQ